MTPLGTFETYRRPFRNGIQPLIGCNSMAVTIHIADTIRCVAKELPGAVTVEQPEGKTFRQLALAAGVPPILIVFVIASGKRRVLGETYAGEDHIHFHGSIAGG